MSRKEQRIKDSLQLIKRCKGITIRDIASLTGVSELTARRDVSELVEKRLVNNVHGTIFYNMEQSGNDSYLLSIAGSKHQSEKRRIGEYAAKIIQPGEFVIIDNGSTTEQLAASIPVNAEATVLCYNVNVLNNLYQKPNINLLFCGGTFHHQTQMFECPESLEIIRRARASKVFVSAAGVHETLGVTCSSDYELPNKREIIKAGVERILLVDSSKFGRVEPYFFSELNAYERIITDSKLPVEWQQHIRDLGINLVMV